MNEDIKTGNSWIDDDISSRKVRQPKHCNRNNNDEDSRLNHLCYRENTLTFIRPVLRQEVSDIGERQK